MDVETAFNYIVLWLFFLIVNLSAILILTLLNLLPTINFKWSLRFLFITKLILLGFGFLLVNAIQNSSWFVV